MPPDRDTADSTVPGRIAEIRPGFVGIAGDRVCGIAGGRVGRIAGGRVGRIAGDRVGGIAGNRVGRNLGDHPESRAPLAPPSTGAGAANPGNSGLCWITTRRPAIVSNANGLIGPDRIAEINMTAPFTAAALEPHSTAPLILALPKGRILSECGPLLARAGIVPAPDYADEDSRRLRFPTEDPTLDVVRVRPFDVATFVAFGAAHIGICGADVLMEFDYPEVYAPLDLGIGRCRIAVAEPAATAGSDDPSRWSRVRVATKYPNVARRHYANRGVHADVVHLNGAMELAPGLGLSRLIVDLVQTGSTLRANGLVETETIAHVTSRLIVNRSALKTQPEVVGAWIARFRAALEQPQGQRQEQNRGRPEGNA